MDILTQNLHIHSPHTVSMYHLTLAKDYGKLSYIITQPNLCDEL